jgi:hypothetical protein
MRTFIVAAAALLAVGTAVPTFAATIAPATDLSAASYLSSSPMDVQEADQGIAATTTTTTKKKKKKTTPAAETASITEIGTAKRGKSDLEIKATTSKAGRQCKLSIKWKDGTKTDAETDAKSDETCEMTIAVPNAAGVVGEATASLTIKDTSGNKVASTSKTFTVK